MDFNKVFTESWKFLSSTNFFAELTSSSPDIPQRFWVKDSYLRNAREAIAVLLVLPLVLPGSRSYFLISDLRDHIKKMAENYRSEGEWEIVREILQSSTSLDIYSSWTIRLNRVSTEDWFGNWIPELRRAKRSLKVQQCYSSVSTDTRPYLEPRRKRGYDDKGSLLDNSLKGRNQPRPERAKPKILAKIPRGFAWFLCLRI
jgi:hypothetical protein